MCVELENRNERDLFLKETNKAIDELRKLKFNYQKYSI